MEVGGESKGRGQAHQKNMIIKLHFSYHHEIAESGFFLFPPPPPLPTRASAAADADAAGSRESGPFFPASFLVDAAPPRHSLGSRFLRHLATGAGSGQLYSCGSAPGFTLRSIHRTGSNHQKREKWFSAVRCRRATWPVTVW